jgi:NAD(P)-dependent dehydrogenase (short-subunit alcohol dehydrogenase family)
VPTLPISSCYVNRKPTRGLLTASALSRNISTGNLEGVFLCSQIAAPLMVKQGGVTIINMATTFNYLELFGYSFNDAQVGTCRHYFVEA